MFPLKRFQDYILEHALLQSHHKVLLAVSGGRDSVLLVHLFKRSGYHFGIAHCNFNLRGVEAERDEDFVRELAASMDVPYHVTHFDTKGYATEHGISTQMAARDLRYHWFEQVRIKEGYDLIAVAHHQTDAMETVLINLTRGTGISGLHGISAKRDQVIRPMLFLSRGEIDHIVQEEQLQYIEDSSNATDHYARNRIRLHVLPQLKAINPGIEQTFEQNINRFRETEMVLQQVVAQKRAMMVRQQGTNHFLSLEAIKSLQPAQLLLFELLKPFHFQEPVVRDLLQSLDKQSGVSFYSASHRATIDRVQLIISPLGDQHLSPQESMLIDEGQQQINFRHQQLQMLEGMPHDVDGNVNKAFLDAGKLVYPLRLRRWQQGDRFMPLGMSQFKKISDFLIDKKVPLPAKEQVHLLINGNDEIVWVIGMRTDNRYKVTSTTKKVTIFELNSTMSR